MTFAMRNAGNTFQRLPLPGLNLHLQQGGGGAQGPPDAGPAAVAGGWLGSQRGEVEFWKPELDFLGHRVTTGGIEPLPGRVQAIADHLAPTNVKEL